MMDFCGVVAELFALNFLEKDPVIVHFSIENNTFSDRFSDVTCE